MYSFTQIHFLEALGYAIVNSLWQSALLWLLVVFINSFIKQSSHLRYITALSAQFGGFALFVITYFIYYKQGDFVFQHPSIFLSGASPTTSLFGVERNLFFSIQFIEAALPYCSLAYLILLIILLAKWAHNFYYTNQLSKVGIENVDEHWQSFVSNMANRLGIGSYVKVYASGVAQSPLTIGYFKPVILLPLASILHLNSYQLEALLLHELAHIKRSDYFINILISIIEILLFFNPFTRLLSKQIGKERENCCDDWVLQYHYDAGMYAKALLQIACIQKPVGGFAMKAASHKKGELLQRIKRMVEPNQQSFNYKHQVAALGLITCILFSVAWLQPTAPLSVSHKFKTTSLNEQEEIYSLPLAGNGSSFMDLKPLSDQFLSHSDDKMLPDIIEQAPALPEVENEIPPLNADVPNLLSLNANTPRPPRIEPVSEKLLALQNADFFKQQVLQNLTMPDLDSNVISNEILKAFASVDMLKSVREGPTSASSQMRLMHDQKLLNEAFSPAHVEEITNSALTSLQGVSFEALVKQMAKSNQALQLREGAEQYRYQSLQEKQKELIRAIEQIQKMKSASTIKALHKLLPPPPPPPIIREVSAFQDDQSENEVFMPLIKRNVMYNESNSTTPMHVVRSVHVYNTGTESSMNIIIEIRQ